MHRTTINVPESVYRQARIKALQENVTVSEVIRELLACWVTGELELDTRSQTTDRRIALVRSAHGMWADRDPDRYLAASRAGLAERDEELAHAQLDL